MFNVEVKAESGGGSNSVVPMYKEVAFYLYA